ncbi:hypothetical protein ACHHYP_03686 [Achlya hypogyna]|uniref:FYVE-type domain-containing protein n=1 Tax=Achlya hypogyna TaxID=1202772 RepID=A0A1V9Z3H7_ACHHY|nr:hypothetical protein ACHHYP_03686 [Achlya hypogyna]
MSSSLLKTFELPHEEEVAFGTRARRFLASALATPAPASPPALEKRGLRVYKDDGKREYSCCGVLNVSLPDIRYALYSDSSKDAKTVAAIMLGKSFHDAAVVRTLQTRSDADPFAFIGVKYLSIQKSALFTKPKALLCLEYSGTYSAPHSPPLLYQILEWVDMKHYVAPENAYHKAIRPACSMVNLFRPVAGNARAVTIVSRTIYATEMPVYLRQINTTASYCDHVLQLSTLPVARRLLDANTIVQHWVPEADCKACSVCTAGFMALRQKHHCRSCGDIMCSSCTHSVQAPTTVNKYCTKCVLGARQREGPPKPVAQVPPPQPLDRVPTFLYTAPAKERADSDDDERTTTDEVHKTFSRIEEKLAEQNYLLSSMRDVLRRQSLASSQSSTTDYDSCASFDPDSLLSIEDDTRFEVVS